MIGFVVVHHFISNDRGNTYGCGDPRAEWALCLPPPIAALVVRNKWPVLVHPLTQTRRRGNSRLQLPIFRGVAQSPALPLQITLSAASSSSDSHIQGTSALHSEQISWAADMIRDLVPKHHMSDEDMCSWHALASWSDRALAECEHMQSSLGGGGASGFDRLGRKRCFEITKLAKFVMLASNLRSGKTLGETVAMSLKAVLPEKLLQTFKNEIADIASGRVVPSKTTLSRACITLDVAYMLWCREEGVLGTEILPILEGVALFVLADSSPQGGRDWFMAEYSAIGGDLKAAFQLHNEIMRLVLDLAGSGARSSDSDSDDGGISLDSQRLAKCVQRLNDMLEFHMMPTQGLGQQRAGLVAKCESLLNTFHHEFGSWTRVRNALACVISFTSDWGTESGLADMPNINMDDIFPHYIEVPLEKMVRVGPNGFVA